MQYELNMQYDQYELIIYAIKAIIIEVLDFDSDQCDHL